MNYLVCVFKSDASLAGKHAQHFPDALVKIYGDQAYAGVFADEIEKHKIKFEKAAKPEPTKGFVPVAKRWLVERIIAWSHFFRRILKDYEHNLSSSVGWKYSQIFKSYCNEFILSTKHNAQIRSKFAGTSSLEICMVGVPIRADIETGCAKSILRGIWRK